MSRRPRAVLHEALFVGVSRSFRRLTQVQIAHAGADAAVAVALASTLFFAVPIGEARDKVALYLALTMAPFALLSPLVGPFLDRTRGAYRLAIIGAGFGRAALVLALATRTDRLTLYPLAFGLLVLSRVHGVSRSALVPDVLPERRSLIWGNSRLAVASVIGAAVGAGLAAGVGAVVGPGLALWLAAIGFVALGFGAFGLPRPDHRDEPERVDDDRKLLTRRLLAGGIGMAASRAAVGYLTFLVAFLLRNAGYDTKALGVVAVAAGVGGFVGSVLTPALRRVLRESLLILATLAVMGAAALWAAGSFDVRSAAVSAGVVGFGAGAGRLAFDSLLQHDAPRAVRGRTFVRYETIFQVCWVAGATAATIIPFTARGGLRILAVICFGGAALSARGLVRPEPGTVRDSA